jgi:uncharacterized protein
VDQDLRRAVELYQQAADQGHSQAICKLGRYWEDGRGVDFADPRRTAELFQQAADLGHRRCGMQSGPVLRTR